MFGLAHARGILQQVILQTLLVKAEDKLKNAEKIIKEHEKIDSTMAVSETFQANNKLGCSVHWRESPATEALTQKLSHQPEMAGCHFFPFFHPSFFFSSKDSMKQDDSQVQRLNSDLQVQVNNLVFALRDITKKERQQVIERVHQDCYRVKEDMSQTLNIQHYLRSLLAESDPFLLIWVRLQNIIRKHY